MLANWAFCEINRGTSNRWKMDVELGFYAVRRS